MASSGLHLPQDDSSRQAAYHWVRHWRQNIQPEEGGPGVGRGWERNDVWWYPVGWRYPIQHLRRHFLEGSVCCLRLRESWPSPWSTQQADDLDRADRNSVASSAWSQTRRRLQRNLRISLLRSLQKRRMRSRRYQLQALLPWYHQRSPHQHRRLPRLKALLLHPRFRLQQHSHQVIQLLQQYLVHLCRRASLPQRLRTLHRLDHLHLLLLHNRQRMLLRQPPHQQIR
jgi:hypothetical protein